MVAKLMEDATMKSLFTVTIALLLVFSGHSFAEINYDALSVVAGPTAHVDVPDGTPMPFDVGSQAPGYYYVEWTEPTGTSIGIFGGNANSHDGGEASRNREPIEDGFDFYMALTTDTGELADWLIEKGDGDPNTPLALRQGHPDLPAEDHTSLGQSFTATKDFTQLGVRAVLWTIAGGGYTVTLYTVATSVEAGDKLATTWGSIKGQ